MSYRQMTVKLPLAALFLFPVVDNHMTNVPFISKFSAVAPVTH